MSLVRSDRRQDRASRLKISLIAREFPVPSKDPTRPRLRWADMALICIFLIGVYTHYTIQISARVPFPSAPAGIAGMIMLWRRRDQITPAALSAFLAVVFLYLVSILCATNISFLGRRFNGLLQLTYSLVIGYALFLTVTQASRRQMAKLFLSFSVVILIGCLLEDYAGLRPISDMVREHLYSRGIYENDLRDMLLYNRVRPKFFASEPASVTFCYSLFTFLWLVLSRWRWKLLGYVALMGLGVFAMPGPTLLLLLLLVLPYELFLVGRKGGPGRNQLDFAHLLRVGCFAGVMLFAFVIMANTIFAARMKEITSGNDASFFYRVLGPALAAEDVIKHYPVAGAGLTGEPFIENEVINVYVRSPAYSTAWAIVSPATELVINYFWLHWIYLGLIWGSITLAAVTVWLRILGVPSPAFCWLSWAILGQASGAYVGPLAWAVLFLAAAGAVLHQRALAREATGVQPIPPARLVLATAAMRRRGFG
ncbi:MAG TPA: hypothetical protein VKY65_09675 [Alphaproteobacteria bacterium]|nr:hypothetical protein [Alphaproteobacteria bacterium]